MPIAPEALRMMIDEFLTQTTGRTRLQRLEEQYPLVGYRGLKQPYNENFGAEYIDDETIDEQFRFQPIEWFAGNPETSNTYTPPVIENTLGYNTTPQTLPARIDPGRSLTVDVEGGDYAEIPVDKLPNDLRDLINTTRDYITTDHVAELARKAGYDTVVFENMRDPSSLMNSPDIEPTTIIAVLPKARHRIRAVTALADPRRKDENDILAGIGGAALLGGASSSLSNPDIREALGL